ncbi:MAG: LysR family transcriptional regulator [Lachnospiraceae bacterium]|nr:LysR family transcriptional regulator [Lachnospiraceae bacterium]
MDIRILRYFLALANTETISGAAEVLHTTQPNLSRQLSELEKEVGRPLFTRGSRKITLTEEGMFLRKRAQEIVDLLDKTEQEFSSFDEVLGGDVYIGGGESRTMRTIAKAIRRLQNDYPQIRYHLISGYAYDIMEYLDKGLLDFGVLFEPVDLTKYDHLRLPLSDTWGLLMRKDHPLAAFPNIQPEQLEQIPLLCSNQMLKENGLSGWLGYDCKKLNIIATFNLINTPALLVEEGIGCAFSFAHLINLSGDCELCFRPLSPKLTSNAFVVWKKYQVFSKAAKKFLEALQQELN